MKAIDTELTKFLGAEVQYYVPIYQRKYSWKKDYCLKLIDDIQKIMKGLVILLALSSILQSRTRCMLPQ